MTTDRRLAECHRKTRKSCSVFRVRDVSYVHSCARESSSCVRVCSDPSPLRPPPPPLPPPPLPPSLSPPPPHTHLLPPSSTPLQAATGLRKRQGFGEEHVFDTSKVGRTTLAQPGNRAPCSCPCRACRGVFRFRVLLLLRRRGSGGVPPVFR